MSHLPYYEPKRAKKIEPSDSGELLAGADFGELDSLPPVPGPVSGARELLEHDASIEALADLCAEHYDGPELLAAAYALLVRGIERCTDLPRLSIGEALHNTLEGLTGVATFLHRLECVFEAAEHASTAPVEEPATP